MPKSHQDLFAGLEVIYKGNVKEGLGQTAKKLGFQHEFMLLNLIAFLRKDENLGRYSIKKTVDQISGYLHNTMNIPIISDRVEETKNNLLALFTVARGGKFNMYQLCAEVSNQIDGNIA